jgi:putative transposase
MARALRIEFEGALYHVTARGNERRKIFFSKRDFEKFKEYMAGAQKKFGFLLHSYVLMSNHYHLLVETPKKNLSRIMHHINSSYTTYINIKRKRSGHLFQGRYKAIVVDKDSYLLELSRYIHLNPVRANLAPRPEDYPYSSYRLFISGEKEEMVTQNGVLGMLAQDERTARERYRTIVEDVLGKEPESPLKKVYAGTLLGDENFVNKIRQRLESSRLGTPEVSHRQLLRASPAVEEILGATCEHFGESPEEAKGNSRSVARKVGIYLAKKHTAATNRQIGELFGGMGYAAVAKTCQRVARRIEKDEALQEDIEALEERLSIVKG